MHSAWVLNERPRGHFVFFCIIVDSLMECDGEEESGEMYSPNESGGYTPCGDMPNFTVQGLRDALNEAESTVTEPPSLAEEFIIQLDVMMADRLGRPRSPAYSWNGGLVRHALKNDPAMGDLKHV